MGNRAVIAIKDKSVSDIAKSKKMGIYLHWNGGYDSVSAFVKYCEIAGYPSPAEDEANIKYLFDVCHAYIGNSADMDEVCALDCDNWDNGVYIIDGWKIVDRAYNSRREQHEYPLDKMLEDIDEAMGNANKEKVEKFINK